MIKCMCMFSACDEINNFYHRMHVRNACDETINFF